MRSTWYGPSRTLGARLAHSSGRRAELDGAQQRRAAAGCARRAQGRAGGPARGRGGAADGPADGSSSSRAVGQPAKPAAGQGRGERASQRASEQGAQGRSPVFFFFFISSVAFSFLSGWQLPRRSVMAVAASAAAHRPGPRVASSQPPGRLARTLRAAAAAARADRERPGDGGGGRQAARRQPAPQSVGVGGTGGGGVVDHRSSSIEHRASSIEHRDDSGQPAGRARAGDSVAAVGADVGPPATGQPVRGTCRRPRRPVTSARVVVVVLTAAAAAAAGRRHGRASGQASSSPPPPRADGRRSLARAAQPAASCFGPTAERGSETGGPRGQRRRAAAARRRDAGRAVGTGDDSSVTRRRCATRRRPSVAGARARPRTPWSAAGGGTPNRGHISHARSGARPGPSASIIGRERAQSKADSTSSELCLSDGASGGTGPPPPPAGLGIKAKKEVQKRRAACAAPLLKRPGTRRAERRCDPARTPCSTLRTNR